ncbi:MAG: hypothetical protein PHY09_11810 [Desulfuromonadaceae bacterium]|nr:hypothetical protein [Desulfuromonadaceae bacterium]MDD5105319.1 hypothetical protein [Desulfuromonadaceae bacterium]
MKKIFLLFALMTFVLPGCGSDGNSGTLSVSAPTASNGIVSAVATYTPATGVAMTGLKINFTWRTYDLGTKTYSSNISDSSETNNKGVALGQFRLNDMTKNLIVYVIASTGDLTNSEGWRSVTVP